MLGGFKKGRNCHLSYLEQLLLLDLMYLVLNAYNEYPPSVNELSVKIMANRPLQITVAFEYLVADSTSK